MTKYIPNVNLYCLRILHCTVKYFSVAAVLHPKVEWLNAELLFGNALPLIIIYFSKTCFSAYVRNTHSRFPLGSVEPIAVCVLGCSLLSTNLVELLVVVQNVIICQESRSNQNSLNEDRVALYLAYTNTGVHYGGMSTNWSVKESECSRLRLKCDDTRAETRFRLSAKRTSLFKSAGASVQSTTGSRGVCISGSNAGYTMFRGSVKSTGCPIHSPVSPSLPLPASPCTFQLDSTFLAFQSNCYYHRKLSISKYRRQS